MVFLMPGSSAFVISTFKSTTSSLIPLYSTQPEFLAIHVLNLSVSEPQQKCRCELAHVSEVLQQYCCEHTKRLDWSTLDIMPEPTSRLQ